MKEELDCAKRHFDKTLEKTNQELEIVRRNEKEN